MTLCSQWLSDLNDNVTVPHAHIVLDNGKNQILTLDLLDCWNIYLVNLKTEQDFKWINNRS